MTAEPGKIDSFGPRDMYLIKLGTHRKASFVFKGLTRKIGHSYGETLKKPNGN